MNTTLVIMAAGIGSRFGGGIKQLQKIGPNGEIIIDYSIHDAIEAGFQKIVFIIRKDIEADFREVIGDRIEKVCSSLHVDVEYAFQSLDAVPEGATIPKDRTKPWGTGQAVLSAKQYLDTPFAVINADDYYGKDAFKKIQSFLVQYDSSKPDHLCMVGYHLKNTLSPFGSVTRGVCRVDEAADLIGIEETSDIHIEGNEILSPRGVLGEETCVSMNMWGFTPEFVSVLEEGFIKFFEADESVLSKKEYLLPIYIGELLPEQKVSVKVLETNDKWFGMTYQEDVQGVKDAFAKLYEDGVYQKELFSDLK